MNISLMKVREVLLKDTSENSNDNFSFVPEDIGLGKAKYKGIQTFIRKHSHS